MDFVSISKKEVKRFCRFCYQDRQGKIKRRILSLSNGDLIVLRGKLKYEIALAEKSSMYLSILALFTAIVSVFVGVNTNTLSSLGGVVTSPEMIPYFNGIYIVIEVLILLGMLCSILGAAVASSDKARAVLALSYIEEYKRE